MRGLCLETSGRFPVFPRSILSRLESYRPRRPGANDHWLLNNGHGAAVQVRRSSPIPLWRAKRSCRGRAFTDRSGLCTRDAGLSADREEADSEPMNLHKLRVPIKKSPSRLRQHVFLKTGERLKDALA